MRIALLLLISFLVACSKDSDPEILDGGEEMKVRYLTITNGDKNCNLYPLGMIGQAPGEVSKPIAIHEDKFTLPYCWSDDMEKYDTLRMDLSGQPYDITKNVTLKK
ncbi:MAG: hypothetical protein IJ379_01335 [Lachnospiraceae bacterium]|nr:hypothetical protein [Lachnospiraceae bacterium]